MNTIDKMENKDDLQEKSDLQDMLGYRIFEDNKPNFFKLKKEHRQSKSNYMEYKSELLHENAIKYKFYQDKEPINFERFINMMKNSETAPDFAEILNKSLQSANEAFPKFFWECHPVTTELKEPFEFVVVNAVGNFSGKQTPEIFQKYFKGEVVTSFKNVGGDAIMIVPEPARNERGYLDFKNINSFIVSADSKTKLALWQTVARELEKSFSGTKVKWLSTSGLGVNYLHVRIDDKPKYFNHQEYKTVPQISPGSDSAEIFNEAQSEIQENCNIEETINHNQHECKSTTKIGSKHSKKPFYKKGLSKIVREPKRSKHEEKQSKIHRKTKR